MGSLQISSSPSKKSVHRSPICFFEPTTCHHQSFSIPEKILYYIAKNVTKVETYQKLVETCKYFYKVNPVIVVPVILCWEDKWEVCFHADWKYRAGFKYGQQINFKIWGTRCFCCHSGNPPQMIHSIYKNDATLVCLEGKPLKFEEFLFLAGNAKELTMWNQSVKYENGKIVQFEEIVKNLPKLINFSYDSCFDGSDVNSNTFKKLMKIEHFKNIYQLNLCNVSETLNVKEMFNFILENKHVIVYVWYRNEISDAYKELVQKYADLLEKEKKCKSKIKFYGMVNEFPTSSSEDDSFDDDNDNFDLDDDNILFPWNNKEDEEWELPWDKLE